MNSIQNKNIVFQDLGLIDYRTAWDYQEKLFRSIKAMFGVPLKSHHGRSVSCMDNDLFDSAMKRRNRFPRDDPIVGNKLNNFHK